MNVYAMLSWYDEPIERLERAIKSAAGAATHLVAVDGRYEAYMPDAPATSDPVQHAAVKALTREAGIELVEVFVPPVPWVNQAAKRTYALRAAEEHGTLWQDWCFWLDADYEVRSKPSFHETLKGWPNAATLEYWFPIDHSYEKDWVQGDRELARQWLVEDRWIALFVRLHRNLRIEAGTHWLITGELPTGARQRLDTAQGRIHDFEIVHHTLDTPRDRRLSKLAYLRARDERREDG